MSAPPQQQQQQRWPNGAKAAVSFTMDNLGEAQDVNKGVWPAGQPVGRHFSVREVLPRVLDMLGRPRRAGHILCRVVEPAGVRRRRGRPAAPRATRSPGTATSTRSGAPSRPPTRRANFARSFALADAAGPRLPRLPTARRRRQRRHHGRAAPPPRRPLHVAAG